MRTRTSNNIGIEYFDSVQEFTRVVETRPNNDAFSRYNQSERGSHRFTGTTNFETAQKYMKRGYKEGAKDLLSCKSSVKILNPAKKVTTFQDVCGFAPIVPNAIIGIPQSMINSRVKVKQARVINILLDVNIAYNVDKDVLSLGGKNVYSLVKSLELRGVRVNLSAFCCQYIDSENKYAIALVKIKDSKQAINPQLIAYPITHPSFFRRHMFKWIETSPLCNYRSMTGDYGKVGRYYMQRQFGSVMRALLDNKLVEKDTYYIDVEKASRAQSVEEIKSILGID